MFLCLVGLAVLASRAMTKMPPIKNLESPIKHVRVEGYFQYLNRDELQAALLPLLSAGYWEADVQAIQAAVRTLPWIEKASVKRIWPDAIAIRVIEKIPYTRWGEKSLITETGDIFTPSDITPFTGLTLVDGPKQQQLKVLETMQGIKTTLADQSLELAEFIINQRGAWQIKLANGLVIRLGRDEQLKKLQRFLKTLPVLDPAQVEAMAVVDLRYPNGFAVTWRPQAPEQNLNQDGVSEEGLAKPKNN